MNLLLTGLNHKTAPVSIREKIAFRPEELPEAFRAFRAFPEIRESLILSTCGRTEIYVVTHAADVNGLIPECLAKYHEISPLTFKNHLYFKEGIEAARHLFCVTSGLDSLVLGEDQILSQVKQYFRVAQDSKTLGVILHRLFQRAIEAGKRIRRETTLGENPGSIGEAALELAKQIFGSLKGRTVLVLGGGEMGRLILEALATSGVSNPMVVTRTREKVEEFVRQIKGTAYSLDEMDTPLLQADILIAASGSTVPLLSRAKLESIMKARRYAPLFVIDIAVPRDIDESAGQLENLFLYDIDDLQQIVENAAGPLQRELVKAHQILEEELKQFQSWLFSLQVTPTIRALTDKFEEMKIKEVQKILSKFPHLSERERAAFHSLAHGLIRKILHQPLIQLKSHAHHPLGAEYVEIVRTLFGLEASHE